MYERFFGFRDQPFRLTPDPAYLYLGSKHREGYAHLLYALREGSGFVAVTGEVGTGKTTLVRSLLRESHDRIAIAYIFNPVLSSVELLQTINAEFGLPSRSTSKKELTETLNRFLLSQMVDGGRAVIIVDEAQNLEPGVLEQLRLLSNLETETHKLLQIILLGQPELRKLLERPDLRQLSQRISLRWHLEPLGREEVGRYIEHRVRIAGAEDNMFEERAVDLIHELTGGVPRLINILAHRTLLVAFTRGARRVGPAETSVAAAELEQSRVPLRTRGAAGWAYRAAAGAGVAVAASLVAFVLVWPLDDDNGNASIVERPRAREAKTADAKASIGGEKSSAQAQTEKAPAAEQPAARKPSPLLTERALARATERFAKRMTAIDVYDGAAKAMSRLIELWTGTALTPAEVASGKLDLQVLGARRGLRYLAVQMEPRYLELVDLPAVVEISLPDGGGTRYVLLERWDRDKARVVAGDETQVERQVLETLWAGKVHLLWRDPERLGRPLSSGEEGEPVERLQRLLADAGFFTGSVTGDYDDATAEAVRKLQADRGLTEDGAASTVTQILLYNSIDRYERPALAGPLAEQSPGRARS